VSDDALADAISGENAAIFAYGVIGPHLKNANLALARQAELDHRNLRDRISETMASPPAAAAVYEMPFPVVDPVTALAAAVTVEERLSVLWRAAVVAGADPAARKVALNAMTAGAIRTAALRRASGAYPGTVPFPGLS
jgi:hypothetical protein